MDGLLIIDKPRGLSSHDVVARVRRLLREKRIGHAGTLDPMATGVLVLCVGHATRLSEYLLGETKAYEGTIALGVRTNTDDAEGQVIEVRPTPLINDETLRQLERQFTGRIAQVPPQFSAIQKGGQRAYALARQGEWVALEARPVHVHEIHLALDDDGPQLVGASPASQRPSSLRIRVRCSAGTYVRALARDIGEALGCGGHLTALRRTQAGRFTLHDAISLEALESAVREGRAESLLRPMDCAVADWPDVHLSEDEARRLKMGQAITLAQAHAPQPAGGEAWMRVYDSHHVFIAIGHWDGTKLKPVKVFDAAPPRVR